MKEENKNTLENNGQSNEVRLTIMRVLKELVEEYEGIPIGKLICLCIKSGYDQFHMPDQHFLDRLNKVKEEGIQNK